MCRGCLVLFLLVLASCTFDRSGIPAGSSTDGEVLHPAFPMDDGGQLVLPGHPPGLAPQPGLPADGKVTVCHVVCDTPKTIEVDRDAAQSHLDHGDWLGACP